MTLDQIVKEYSIEVGDSQLNRYSRYYQLGLSGLREFNMNFSGVVRVTEMCINENSTCYLPEGYIKYRVIGLRGEDGNLHSLGRNDSMSIIDHKANIMQQGSQGLLSEIFTNEFIINNYSDSYRNGEFVGKMFGINGGNNGLGQFRIDVANGLILLNNIFPNNCKIVMEYLADINACEGDFEVHPFSIEALKSWIYWKHIQRDRARNPKEKQQAEHDYRVAATKAKNRFNMSTIQEWKEAFRSGSTASVKW